MNSYLNVAEKATQPQPPPKHMGLVSSIIKEICTGDWSPSEQIEMLDEIKRAIKGQWEAIASSKLDNVSCLQKQVEEMKMLSERI
jgi:hypothetical protein